MPQKEKFSVKAAFVTDDKAHAVTIMPAVSSVIDIQLFDWESLENRDLLDVCLLYTSPSPRDQRGSRMPSSA